MAVPHSEIKAKLEAERKAKKSKPKRAKVVVGLAFLLLTSSAWAQTYDVGNVLKWEKKSYSQSAHITREHTVYTVRVGSVTYEVARRSDKVEMGVGKQLKCRVDKDHFFALNEKGKEIEYEIVDTE